MWRWAGRNDTPLGLLNKTTHALPNDFSCPQEINWKAAIDMTLDIFATGRTDSCGLMTGGWEFLGLTGGWEFLDLTGGWEFLGLTGGWEDSLDHLTVVDLVG